MIAVYTLFLLYNCYETTYVLFFSGDKIALYGKQRLWGSVGWGIFSLMTGALIDVFSEGAYKDYTVAFVLMFIFMCGDVAVSCFVKVS